MLWVAWVATTKSAIPVSFSYRSLEVKRRVAGVTHRITPVRSTFYSMPQQYGGGTTILLRRKTLISKGLRDSD